MLAHLRRLLVAAFLVGCFVAVGAAPAQACTCAAPGSGDSAGSLTQRIKDADAVFTGTVSSVVLSGVGPASVITNTVEAERVYKGDLEDPEQVVRTTQRTQASCGLGQLKVDARYVFVVLTDTGADAGTDTAAPAGWVDDGCSGTRVATSSLVTEVRGVLGSGQPATPPAPPPAAVLTDVDVTEPARFSRVAAPGAALVLLGLLGLVLVRRLRSRRP